MASFMDTLRVQRWDDHRFYHHSRINQSLHFVSSCSFIAAYGLLFYDPPIAALLGWVVGMVTRQSGHFFFEPKGYDHANQATHEHKEEIKVGYNLFRKIVLMTLWAVLPCALLVSPSLFGLMNPSDTWMGFARNVGSLWLAFAVAGVLFRMGQLVFISGVQSSLAWGFKIVTDPFHDFMLYRKAPLALLRGELMDQSIAGHRPH